MSGSTPMLLAKKTQEAVIQFYRQCFQLTGQQWNLREQMQYIDRVYMREVDLTKEGTRAKLANRVGDSDRYQNITIPLVLPAVEEAVAYQASVFLTGNPIFGVVSDPSNEDAALQLETVIDNQAVKGGWIAKFAEMFRDGFKYNLAAVEVAWTRQITQAVETDMNFTAGKQGKPKEVIWEGNTIRKLDMYNTFFDTRIINPADISANGEFAGYIELMSRIQLKKFIAELPDKMIDNIKIAFETNLGGDRGIGGMEAFFLPQLNPRAMIQKNTYATTDWLQWAQLVVPSDRIDIAYKNVYQVTTLYGRILPSDFGLKVPGANTPQVWKFIIVNNQVVIYAERQTNVHNLIPILFSQPNADGLGYQTKSLAHNVEPMQSVGSAMMNAGIAARRRAISDRGLYDPSRVSEAHINSVNPSAKIPVRPSAYGKPLSEAYYPIPFRDDQSPILMQQIQGLSALSDKITGQNPARQGQFVKGNKTLHEFKDVMDHANGRDQLCAMLYETQLFTPLKYILKSNILQYQGGISLFNRSKQKEIQVDPVTLRKTILEFKISDGLNPVDKLINADAFQTSIQVMGSSLQIASGYNIGPAFSYLMKTQGADLTAFEKSPQQVAYEQAVQQWQQLAQLAISKGQEFKIPQPLPQQFGYDPTQQGAPAAAAPATKSVVENIQKNQITAPNLE